MRRNERAVFEHAARRARLSAYTSGEFIGQESFMTASEILSLAVRAGVTPEASVLDLCCGMGAPGRLITAQLGCTYLGVDADSGAIDIARGTDFALGIDTAKGRASSACRFEVARIPPLPAGPFDVVLLLETLLAFPDKQALLHDIASVLVVGGRFAFTFEEGQPLTEAERESMPNCDTVWLMPLPKLLLCLERAGLRVLWQEECSRSHEATVGALTESFAAEAATIRAHIGSRALTDLLAAHRLWSRWLGEGRVRKYGFVAEKVATA